MGTFRESDIGIGTVVAGSAAFNVLFVIGMCSIFAKDVLTLTWWPLFRDSTYYAVGLVVLSMLAGVCSKGHITWWEAAILLGMYVGYVVLMAFNRKLYTLLTGKELVLGGEDDSSEPLLGQETSDQQHEEGYTSFRPDGKGEIVEEENSELYTASQKHLLSKIGQMFDDLDPENAGVLNRNEFFGLLMRLEPIMTEADVEEALEDAFESGTKEEITFEKFTEWYYARLSQKEKGAQDEARGSILEALMPPQEKEATAWLKYLISLPLLAAFTFTVPDVR